MTEPPTINPAIAEMMRASRELISHEHSLFRTFNLKALSVGAGEMKFSLDLNAEFGDGGGAVHGGLLTIILDSIFGMTVFTALEEMKPIATINLRTDYLAAAPIGARAICEARCVGIRNDVAYVRGALSAEPDGSLYATAAGAFMVGTSGRSKGSRL